MVKHLSFRAELSNVFYAVGIRPEVQSLQNQYYKYPDYLQGSDGHIQRPRQLVSHKMRVSLVTQRTQPQELQGGVFTLKLNRQDRI